MKLVVEFAILGKGDLIEKMAFEGAKDVSHVDIW